MSSNGHMTAAKIRASLRHPIIDADGHWLEYGPVVREQLKKIGGEKAVEGFGLFGAQVVNSPLSVSLSQWPMQSILFSVTLILVVPGESLGRCCATPRLSMPARMTRTKARVDAFLIVIVLSRW